MVTHSRMVVLSPISAWVFSPLNFKSCGIADITAPGNIRQFLPMRAPSIMLTLDPIQEPSPISTSLWMVTNGSITTLSAIFACGCIYANGWIMLTYILQFAPLVRLLQQFFRPPYQCLSFAQYPCG